MSNSGYQQSKTKSFRQKLSLILRVTLLAVFIFNSLFFYDVQEALAATAFDAAGTASSSLISYTVTVAAAGPNPFLIVAVGIRESLTTVSTVSSDLSGALTFLRAENVAIVLRQEIWTLTAPATGTHVITITLVGAQESEAIAVTVKGANQTTPVTNHTGATGADAVPTVTVTSAADRLVIGFVFNSRDDTDAQIIPGANQTQRASVSGPTANRPRSEATDEAGAGSVVTSWTKTSIRQWGVSAIDVVAPKTKPHKVRGKVKIRGKVKFR